jgi:hypothetical protein
MVGGVGDVEIADAVQTHRGGAIQLRAGRRPAIAREVRRARARQRAQLTRHGRHPDAKIATGQARTGADATLCKVDHSSAIHGNPGGTYQARARRRLTVQNRRAVGRSKHRSDHTIGDLAHAGVAEIGDVEIALRIDGQRGRQ